MNIHNISSNMGHTQKILQAAIAELAIFTTSQEVATLHVNADGCLVSSTPEPALKKVVDLARTYIMPLFSEKVRKQEQDELLRLRNAILRIVDTIQSHSGLIKYCENGSEEERAWAKHSLDIIKKYNNVIASDQTGFSQSNMHRRMRQLLLLDPEIKGRKIKMPAEASIKYDSTNSSSHVAGHAVIKKLSATLQAKVVKPQLEAMQNAVATPKNYGQCACDMFRVKAINLIKSHWPRFRIPEMNMSEIFALVKLAPIEMESDSDPQVMHLQQLLEIGPGSFISVSGTCQLGLSDSKFKVPSFNQADWRVCYQFKHCGFPYSSQYNGCWALFNECVDARPLRAVALFDDLAEKQKQLTARLVNDPQFASSARRKAKIKQEIFDQNRQAFIDKHRQWQEILIKHDSIDQTTLKAAQTVLDNFYAYVLQSDRASELLIKAQEEIVKCFVSDLFNDIEQEWLVQFDSPLRIGTPQEKLQAICLKLEEKRLALFKIFDSNDVVSAYIAQQGMILGNLFQSIGLQYLSEKMGFRPLMLSDLQRKLQACAFRQLIVFLNECEHEIDETDHLKIKFEMENSWHADLQLIGAEILEEETNLPESSKQALAIVNEMEKYFFSRFTLNHANN